MDRFASAEEIHSAFTTILVESLGVDPSTITPEATLDELGAQSLDVVEISMEVESRFNVWLPDKSILETAVEVVGRETMFDGQFLSESAKDLFRVRLPREEWSLLDGDMTAADLRSYFMRVSTWLRMIADLREHTPKACSSCGHAKLSDSPGFVLTCDECGHEMKLRSGEDINRDWVTAYFARKGVDIAHPNVADAIRGEPASR